MTGATPEGKVAVITGAGRGLGRQMTLGLVGAGAKVAMVEIDADALEAAAADAESAGGQGCVLPIVADVTDETRAAEAVAQTVGHFGSVDVLVNDAAIGPQAFRPSNLDEPLKVWEVDLDLWRRVQLVNATGPYIMARNALPHMLEKGWGRIVNVTTSLDTMWRETMGPYGPAKAALEALTAMMSQELEGTGVTANVLIPGGRANTRMIPDDGEFADRSTLVQPEVMVAPIRWLASTASDGVNGRRFIGAHWDSSLPPEEAAEAAGAPVAWQQLGRQAIR
jgi:3-oxoacyl-[acyl-carrier protein] reductase